MSWLSKALGLSSSQNPANAAQPYLNQIPDVGHQYYDPYIKNGQNPGEFLNQLQSGYKPSDAYQFKSDELQKGMRAMGAAGGYGGTPFHQMQYGEQADQLLSGDMQQYLQNALGIYDQGLNASGSMAGLLSGNLESQATNAFTGQQQQNQSNQALISALMKALGQGAGAGVGYMGGGWSGAADMLSGGQGRY